jgi:hypothetical protein
MPQYTITIDGFESGLTEHAVEQTVRESLACPEPIDVTVESNESDSMDDENPDINVERDKYVNVFSNGRLIVSISEYNDEVLVYESGTDEPISQFKLSLLESGDWMVR